MYYMYYIYIYTSTFEVCRKMGVALNPWQVIGLFGHGSLLGF